LTEIGRRTILAASSRRRGTQDEIKRLARRLSQEDRRVPSLRQSRRSGHQTIFRFDRARALNVITLSHEPGVGFAADGYARTTGRIGAICVTYGAGGDNMVKPVARHFASACRYSSSAAARERKNPTLAC